MKLSNESDYHIFHYVSSKYTIQFDQNDNSQSNIYQSKIIIILGALMFIINPNRLISSVSAADYGTKTYTKDYSLPKSGSTSSTTVINKSSLSGQQSSSNVGGHYYQQQPKPLQPQISPSSLLAGALYKMPATTSTSAESNTIQAAVQSKHEIQFRDYPTTGNIVPTTVEVGAISVPLNILFKSASSSLRIQQAHEGSEGSVQETESEGRLFNFKSILSIQLLVYFLR